MKINIYYGGRGVIGDPTLYVLKKMTTVFEAIHKFAVSIGEEYIA